MKKEILAQQALRELQAHRVHKEILDHKVQQALKGQQEPIAQ